MYSWTDVAARTERVYNGITGVLSEEEFYGGSPAGWGTTRTRGFALIDRLKRYYGCGIWAGKLFCLCVVVDYLLLVFLEFWMPRERIDVARDWPRKRAMGENEGRIEVSNGLGRTRSGRKREGRWD
jgi:phosphatidylinositol glycan class A protein